MGLFPGWYKLSIGNGGAITGPKCPIGNGGGHYLFRLNPGLMGFDRISRLQSVYCERFFFRFPLFRDPRQLLGARSVMGGVITDRGFRRETINQHKRKSPLGGLWCPAYSAFPLCTKSYLSI